MISVMSSSLPVRNVPYRNNLRDPKTPMYFPNSGENKIVATKTELKT